MKDPVHVITGPSRHGVNIHARRLRRAMGGLEVAASRPGDTAIAHFTERIWSDRDHDPVRALVRATEASTDLTLVLHDLPDPRADLVWTASRMTKYAAVAQHADRVVVASRWERDLLARALDVTDARATPSVLDRCHVVGLPIATPSRVAGRHSSDGAVVTMGFLYPGKGTEEVIAAVRTAGLGLKVVNLGGADAGHPQLEAELQETAAIAGVRWTATGWLSQRDLHARMRAAAVPVVFHHHVSASGSINEWLALGRRPLVRSSPYTLELAERLPGAVALVEDHDELSAGIAAAVRHPERTWLAEGARCGSTWEETGARLRQLSGVRAPC